MFIEEVNFDFDNLEKGSFLRKLPYYKIKQIKFNKNIIFLIGDNGVGKTSLLEALAYNFNLNKYGGSNNFILDKDNKPEMIRFIQIPNTIDKVKDAFFFRSDTFFNLQNELERYGSDLKYQYSGDKTFKEQSHGEGFMSFFKNRIREKGLYFFDEPETALSFENQILFLFLLRQFENNNNQIFIITHSPVLLSYPNAQIINIGKDFIGEVEYEDTDQFVNLKDFLNNYKSYQREIMNFR